MSSLRVTLESFMSEYHKLKDEQTNGIECQSLPFARISPWPQLLTQEDKPGALYWFKEILLSTSKDQSKGETDGDAFTIAQKNKVRQPQESQMMMAFQ